MHGVGVACYGRNDLSFNVPSLSPREIQSIFLTISHRTNNSSK